MEVIWSEFAEKQLDKIFKYYFDNIGEHTANKIVLRILLQTEKLEKAQFIGQKEGLLENRKLVYRYLIYTNYKIIYHVNKNEKLVRITDIFDVRQNPSKLKRNK